MSEKHSKPGSFRLITWTEKINGTNDLPSFEEKLLYHVPQPPPRICLASGQGTTAKRDTAERDLNDEEYQETYHIMRLRQHKCIHGTVQMMICFPGTIL